MLNFFKSSLEKAFGSVIAALIIFVVVMFLGSFAFKSVGALSVPIDRPKTLGQSRAISTHIYDDTGMLFILKDMSSNSNPTNVSLEVNEISNPKLFSGLGSLDPINNGTTPIVKSRYMRVDGVPLQNNSRSDYVVIGKGTGGKVSGTVLVGGVEASNGVFITNTQFYFLCGCFFVFGGIVSGLFAYFVTINKSTPATTTPTDILPVSQPKDEISSPLQNKSKKKKK